MKAQPFRFTFREECHQENAILNTAHSSSSGRKSLLELFIHSLPLTHMKQPRRSTHLARLSAPLFRCTLVVLMGIAIFGLVDLAHALPVSERTPQVRDEIVDAVPGVDAAADVTEAHLAAITSLNLSRKSITSLKSGDFDGLTALVNLSLSNNQLSALPPGIFDNNTALIYLDLPNNQLSALPPGIFDNNTTLVNLSLSNNQLSALPPGIFDNNTTLRRLSLSNNQLSALPPGIFSGLSSMIWIMVDNNQLTTLPENTFSGLSSLTLLNLYRNNLSSLPEGLFSGLSSLTLLNLYRNNLSSLPEGLFSGLSLLTTINLGTNQLSSLPEGLFSGLSSLTLLNLYRNNLSSLPEGLFSGLSSLTTINLEWNQLSNLPSDIFSGLSLLTTINLGTNQLSSLPEGLFSGLSSLTSLNLNQNAAELSIIVLLQEVAANQFKVMVRPGAPFNIVVPINVMNGSIDGGGTIVTIPTGSVESEPFTVTPIPGTSAAITVEIGTLPSIPSDHRGYSLIQLNRAPEFTEGPITTRTVAEDTTAGINIGTAVSATDVNNDLLTYTLSGADANFFTVDNTTGQLRTSSTLDYETKPTYTVTVTVTDGTFTSSIIVTINVTDVEPETFYVSEPRTVRLFYYLPNDRPYRQEVVDAMKTGIIEIQSFYAEQMEAHGHGNMTFQIETDAQGDPIVHRVDGANDNNYYDNRRHPGPEIDQAFDNSDNVHVIVMDINRGLSGLAGGGNKNTRWAIVYGGWNWRIAAHELGHAFGLLHDFRDDAYLMSYGSTDQSSTELSAFAADFLSVQPYFNPDISLEIESPPTFELLSPTIYLTGAESVPIRLRVRDDDGIHQVILLVKTSSFTWGGGGGKEVKTYRKLAGETDTIVEFDYDGKNPSGGTSLSHPLRHEIYFMVVDTEGNNAEGNYTGSLGWTVFTLEGLDELYPLAGRTRQVQDAIVAAVPDIDNAADVTEAHLATITSLDLSWSSLTLKTGDFSGLSALTTLDLNLNDLTSLPEGVFSGLSALTTLNLSGNDLTSLPEGVFSGLSSLTTLNLNSNDLTSLPEGVFSSLSALTTINLNSNDLTSLPTGVFSGLSALTTLDLRNNDLTSLPTGVFSGLSALTTLDLTDNDLTSLPTGVFSGLSALTTLRLNRNDLTSLPEGVFSGLSALTTLILSSNDLTSLPEGVFSGLSSVTSLNLLGNAVEPMPLPVSLEKVGDDQFKAVAPAGAPFDIVLPLTLTNGSISGGAPTVTILTGSTESKVLTVTRTPDTTGAVTVNIRRVPLRPSGHTGYALVKSADLLLSYALPEIHTVLGNRTPQVRDAIVSAAGVNSATDLTEAHLAAITELNLWNKGITSLKSGDFDGLSGLTRLLLRYNRLTTLPSDIFDGLTALTRLDMAFNDLSSLPAGLFEGLTGLTTLSFSSNAVRPLPLTVSLEKIGDNQFKAVVPTGALFAIVLPISVTNGSITGGATTVTIPKGSVESEVLTVTRTPGTTGAVTVNIGTLPSLPQKHFGYALVKSADLPLSYALPEIRILIANRTPEVRDAIVAAVPGVDNAADVTETHLAAITELNLRNKGITSLKSGDFDGLTALTSLSLHGNDLIALPSGIFDELTALTTLYLGYNDLTALRSGIFDELTALTTLYLGYNDLTALRSGIFDELTALTYLHLGHNRDLTSLPPGVFDNNTELTELYLFLTSLGALRAGVFDNNTALTTLELQGSGLSSLPSGVFDELTALTVLNLDLNRDLASLPSGVFDNNTELTVLNLGSNRLTSLPSGVFDNNTALTTLELSFSDLTALRPGVFDQLTALTTLELDDIGLSSLPPGIFDNNTELTDLNLDDNALTALPSGVFDQLTALTTLYLNGNALSSLPSGVFDNNTELTRLRLNNNNISDISELEYLTTLELLSLRDNPISDYAPLRRLIAAIEAGGGSLQLDITIPASFLLEGRTPEVRDAIVRAAGVNSAADVTEAHLAEITELSINHTNASLKSGDFDGLSSLTHLSMVRAGLTSLPSGIFDSLPALENLQMGRNNLSELPAGLFDKNTALKVLDIRTGSLTTLPTGIFDNNTALTSLNLGEHDISSLPAGIFDNNTALNYLTLWDNELSSLPAGIFDNNTALTSLGLENNNFTSLPSDIFNNLTKLTDINLNHNKLSSLPARIFKGLTALDRLRLFSNPNPGSPLSLTVSLEKVGDDQFKAVAPAGAPFAIVLPISVTNGSITDGATTLTIPTGSVESEVLTVTRTPDTTGAVTVNIGTLPSLPSNHRGYALVKSADLPLSYALPEVRSLIGSRTPQVRDAIIAAVPGVDNAADVTETHLAAIESLTLDTNGALYLREDDFSGLSSLMTLEFRNNGVLTLPEGVFTGLSSLTTLRLFNNGVLTLPEGVFTGLSSLTTLEMRRRTLTVTLTKVGEGQFKAVAPTGAPFDIVLPISVTNGSISGRATTVTIPKGSVESEVLTVTRASGASFAVSVDIGTLPGLPADHTGYTLVKSADLPLTFPELGGRVLTPVSERTPEVRDAIVQAAGVNSAADVTETHLAAITRLSLSPKNITTLKVGDFDGLTGLESLLVTNSSLSSLPSGIFDDLTNLEVLNLERNKLSSLPVGIFDKLSALTTLYLSENDFSSLSADIFDDLSDLTTLDLGENQLSTLPAGIFDKLTALTRLELDQNRLSSLPADIFDDLSDLTFLNLYNNQLSSLPVGIFDRLTNLTNLYLSDNPGSPFSLTVSLEKVADGQFKAVAPTGAPFEMVLPLTVTNGTIYGGAISITIAAGSVESSLLTVGHTVGTTANVTVDIGTLPGLPANHQGYTLVKSADLPLVFTELAASTLTPLSERTQQVSGEVMRIQGLNSADDVTEVHIAGIGVLNLRGRGITSLKSGDFDGFSTLTHLHLNQNQLSELPDDIFSGLSTLTYLDLSSNQLSGLPDGVFNGLSTLRVLLVDLNTVDPLPLTVSLEKVADGQFKAVAPAGAPFEMVLPLTVTNGSIVGSANTITIPAGSVESDTLTVTRTAGTTAAVTVNIGTLPDLPADHEGYELIKSADLPLEVISATAPQVRSVNIPDPNLRAKIEDALGKTSGDPITATEMATLTSLNAQDSSISDLTGLETATNLTTLKLGNNSVSDISALAGLTNLTELQLWDNQISNISILASLTNLTKLYIWRNSISDISALAGLTSLTQLKINENTISNISILARLTNLTELSLKDNAISDISAVAGLTNLTELQIGNNTITNITPVQNLTKLVWLDMPNNSISDISVVQNLTKLAELYFQNNAVSDLSPLVANTGFGEFTELNASGNPLNYPSIYTHIPALQAKNVYIGFDNRVATTPVKISGDTQSGNTGTTLAQPFVVEMQDASRVAFAGVPVTFAVTAGGGTLSVTNTTTDTNGRAESTLTLGNTAGTNTVRVSIQGVSQTATFTATATTTNTAPVFTDDTSTTRSIAENTAAGINIGTAIAATDADNDTLTYTLSGTDAASFDINSTTGQLKTQTALDYETKSSYSVTVSVSDGNSGSDSITVTINVTDVDEQQTDMATYEVGDDIPLPSGFNTPRLTMGPGRSLTADNGTYTCVSADNCIIQNGQVTQGTIEVTTVAANTAPVFTDDTSTTRSIAENTAAGINIGTAITATDADNDTLTYTLGGTDAASFSINSSTGQLQTKVALDYETKRTYTVTVTVSDGSLTDTITVTINVTDIDDTAKVVAVVNIPDPNLRAEIEDALGKKSGDPITPTEMATLTSLTAQDASISNLTGLETATNLTTLKLGDNSISDISALAGLTNLTELQLWDNQISNLSILASLTNLTKLYIWGNSISDISALAGLTSLTQLKISENTISNISILSRLTNLTELSLKDNAISDISALAGLTNLTELLIGNNTISNITPVQNLTNLEWLDMPNNRISDVTAVVNLTNLVELYFQDNTVSDLSPLVANTGFGEYTELDARGNPLSYPSIYTHIPALQARNVYIDFDNRVATAPVKISGDTQSGTTGTTLAQPFVVEVQDASRVVFAGVPVTFAVTAGGGTLNVSNTTTNANGRAESTLTLGNTAGTNTVHVSVQGISTSVTFTATATTTNTAPTFTDGTSTTRTIAENTAAGINIGTAIAATDANNDPLTYTLAGTDASAFDIDSTTGQLTTKAVLDYETKSTYTVTVTVSDGTLTDSITVTINITDVAETPTETGVCQVGNVLAPGESCTYPGTDTEFSVLSDGRGQFLFFTSGTSLNIKDTEINGVSYTLVTEKLASGSWKIEEIADSAETPGTTNTAPVFTDGASTTRVVAENTAAGVNIGSVVVATDADNDTLTYTLSGTDAASFGINSTTGQLRTRAALDYETKRSYTVTVTVTDGSFTGTIAVTINVTNVVENSAPAFTESSSTTRSVAENTATGVNIGAAIAATDADNDALTYTLSGTDAASFSIVRTSGQLRTRAALDYETKRTYTVTITVSDGSLTDAITVTINVTDIDDTSPVSTLTLLSGRTPQVRDAIVAAVPGVNSANDVTEAHLAAITNLNLSDKSITSLKANDFSGLSSLTQLYLHNNQLTTLPDGVFAGLSSLTRLYLRGNTVDPLPLTVSLEKVGEGQFKAVAPTGAPFDIVLPINVTNGSINGGATTITILKSSVESDTLTVSRTSGTTFAVTVNIGTLPGLPPNHQGYQLAKSTNLPLEIISPLANSAPVFTESSSTTRSVAENTATGVNIGSAVAATDADNDTLTYTLGGTNAASFGINSITGQLRTRAALDYETKRTYTVTVTVSDGSLTDTITVTINVNDVADTPVVSTLTPVCDRTPQVRDAIVAAVRGVSDCSNVTETHLAAIRDLLDLRDKNISALKPGDFEGLSSLQELRLESNQLRALPADIFSGLSSLRRLYLGNNQLTSLPPDVFSELTALHDLYLHNNQLTSLPVDLFAGLSSLRQINLHTNRLTNLPADIFSGLSSLTQLFLRNNKLTSLPADLFSGLSSLQYLYLDGNRLTSLPADLFSGLPSLTQLLLNKNQMSTLSVGMFRGLTASTQLWLQGNRVDPLPLTISLEKVGGNQFKATVPAGAPFTIVLPLRVANGAISGGANTLTIPQGSVESGRLTVTRTAGTTAAVTVDIGTLPGLPTNHQGYQLTRSANLPLEIFSSAANRAPTFTEGASTTRAVAENTAPGVNIGAAITATDADNDTLTYTLSGTDAASFSINSSTGQLQTKSALDYETKTTYTATVTVSDGSLTDTITVTINVTDVDEAPTDIGVCKVGDILAPGESCTYPGTDATFSVLDNGHSQWNIPDLPSWLAWINQTFIGGSMRISATINNQDYHFVAEEVSNDSWEIKEIGEDRPEQPETPEQPEQPGDVGETPTLTVSTASSLTEATLHGGVATLTLSGGTYESTVFDIRRSLTVSGITSADFETFSVVRVSDTQATVELEFDGNISTSGTLTFNLDSDAITNYEGAALTSQISVPAVPESVVASTASPLTEATLDESVVTLTLSGRKFEQWTSKIRGAMSVSGITGATFETFSVVRVNDTEVSAGLTFDGNINSDSTLTFTVGADAIAGYDGPALTAQVSVSATTEAPTVPDSQTPQQPQQPGSGGATPTLTASTTAPLTEATLHESIVTLTLSGAIYEDSTLKVRDDVTVSTSISGVTVDWWDIDEVSDTEVAVELTFDGDFDTNATLTFTVEADAIAGYNGPALTAQISVTGGPESIVASTTAPLTEATLNESVVTLTLNGRKFERNDSTVRTAVSVSGIAGVTVQNYNIDRESDTEVTVELTFNGNINTNSTLTFTVGADAIAGYDGAALTAQVSVSASEEPVEIGGGTPTLRASTPSPLTEATLNESVVTLTLTGGTYESTTFDIRRSLTVSGITGADFEPFSVVRVSDTQATVELEFDGNISTNSTLTFTLRSDAIANYDGDALTSQISVSALPESVVASTASPLTEATLDESVVTLTLTGATYERSTSQIRDAVTVSGINGVTKPWHEPDRESNTEITLELEFDGTDFDTNSTLTFTVGADAIAGYNGPALTAQLSVSASTETPVVTDVTDGQTPVTPQQPQQQGGGDSTLTLRASTPSPLTETTLHESVVTLTLTGRIYSRSTFDIRDAVTVSGINGVTIPWHDPDRESDTELTLELEFNGDFDTDATLTFTVGAEAIANYDGSALTAQVPVTGGPESIVPSTEAPLTEATLDESVVTLTLTGRNYARSIFDIRDAVTVSGINGVTIPWHDPDRESDTELTLELEFDGTNFDSTSTLIFTVGADAIADYNGPALTAQITVTATEQVLRAPSGISLMHVPLQVTAVNGVTQTIESVGDLYNALGGMNTVNLLITHNPKTQEWHSYLGESSRGTSADTILTDNQGIIADMKAPVSLHLGGDALGSNGSSFITLHPGTNLVGVPLKDPRITRVSDLFALEGIGGNVSAITVTQNETFQTVEQAGDAGDIPITGGQSFILNAWEETTVAVSGQGWDNVSGRAAAAPVALTGIQVMDTTPILALRGSIVSPVGEWNRMPRLRSGSGFRVIVKNLSTRKSVATMTGDEGGRYQLTVVDTEAGRAAQIGDILEISVRSPDPRIGVQPLRHTITAEDVKSRRVELDNLIVYEIPTETELLPNYPNPFNPETWIPYRLAEDAFVTLTIYDQTGQVVRTLEVGHQIAGYYTDRTKAVYWDGKNEFGEQVASGIYFYHLSAGDYSATRKMLIIK